VRIGVFVFCVFENWKLEEEVCEGVSWEEWGVRYGVYIVGRGRRGWRLK